MEFSSSSNFSLFKNNPTKKRQLSTFEAFNIFNALQTRYVSMCQYNFLLNFIHDKDFTLLARENLNDINKQIIQLEKRGEKFNLCAPQRPPKEVNIKEKVSKYLGDKQIFQILNSVNYYLLSHLINCIIQTTVNDSLREMFIDFTFTTLKNINRLIEYGKLKNWMVTEPVIKQTGNKEKEKIAAGEAASLWEHIYIRYDHLEITKSYLDFIHDPEFKKIVKKGQSELQRQVEQLEKKALENGLSLPERPPAYNKSKEEPEFIKDKFIFRTIFRGVKNSTYLHINAITICNKNDNLRKHFFGLLKEELNIFDSFLRYGKMKGWVHLPPMFE